MERLMLLVSDVDHTLLGDDEALEQFADWFAARCEHIRLAYNSGRFFHSVWESVQDTNLPTPDALIGGVGTEVCFPPDGRRLPGWPVVSERWNPNSIRRAASAYKQLEPQPEELQSRFKVSFYGYELDSQFLDELRERLSDVAGPLEIVYSSDRDLDVLPANTNKGTAAARLAQHWQIAPSQVIVAGDSGNDGPMFGRGFRGIIVGNAKPELAAIEDANAYRADGRYAAGVIEGLRHWLSDSPAPLTAAPSTRGRDADRGTRG